MAQPIPKTPRLTKCRICRTLYKKLSISHKACSPACALELVKLDKAKKARKATIDRRKELKPRREHVAAAQSAFNAFIRARDKDLPCICCGEWPKVTGKYGGDWDAGHFLTVGGYPELRFIEDNCHKQQKSCNAGSGKYTAKGKTVSQSYRERLIIKIGLDRVEELEGPHAPKQYSIPDLVEIRRVYRDKLKLL